MNEQDKREKEINYLLYLKKQLIRHSNSKLFIKETKKEMKKLIDEKRMINGYKKLEKKRGKRK